MNEALFLDLLRETLWTTLLISTPLLLSGLVVGTLVSLAQIYPHLCA
jgi:flagellar biosynthesis protein FliQ